jgi:hypothetical protein
MAKAELRYGHNEQLHRLAQEIVVNQQQEITTMRLAVGDELPRSAASPTQPLPPDPGLAAQPSMNMSPDSMRMK